ncbi:MAG: DUF4880 domain-containing protein [Verrucomicrobia bacterium]|nr:DUF4880 domain-containing protein [Verrucomicrobiota bacterium]
MSTEVTHEAERIEEEASLWAARLRGGAMTDADRSRLADWLARDPEHGAVLARYRELAAQLDEHLDSGATERAGGARRRWWFAAVGLGAAAAITLAWIGWAARAREFSTATAERHVASLRDGTRVELNAQTKLAVDFTRGERRVRLARGEAFFVVAKEAARPFVVETPAGSVRVTGTAFNVRAATATRTEVTVLEGHVRVRPAVAGDDAALTSGRQAILSAERIEVRTLGDAAAQDAAAWRTGLGVFEDTPLRDALERFAAYHTRTVTVAPEVADLRLGGRYALDDLDGALEAIERTLAVRVERGAAGAVRIVAAGAR